MADVKTYHVRFDDDGWIVEAEGNAQPSARTDRKTDAVARAREIAENQQPARVAIHKKDGTLQEERSYGDVPAREGPLAADAIYALAALSSDALSLASESIQLARELPSRAQQRADELRELASRRDELDDRIRDLRETIGQRLDEKATQGRSLTGDLLGHDRIQRVLDQARAARSQVKAAVTSIRRIARQTAKGAAEAGEGQVDAARSQVKAAATSVRKTVETAADQDDGG